MTLDTRPVNSQADLSSKAGVVALALGTLFVAATAYAYALSLIETFNPPNWVRILGLMWLPIGLIGTPIAYSVARHGEGRALGQVGLALAFIALSSFIVLLFALG
jgi:hypothetical protein